MPGALYRPEAVQIVNPVFQPHYFLLNSRSFSRFFTIFRMSLQSLFNRFSYVPRVYKMGST